MAFEMEVMLLKTKRYAEVDKKVCVACGECTHICRKNAISVKNGCYASVDADICVGCGLCSKSCPAGCITMLERGVM